jgi:hypothetical protein
MRERVVAQFLRALALTAIVLVGAVLVRNITGALTVALW